MSHPGPHAQSPLGAATEICRRLIRRLLDRAAARKRQLNLILLAVLTVLFLVTLVAYGLRMSK
jgi:hypothetical protein